jgi:hypothetical protein
LQDLYALTHKLLAISHLINLKFLNTGVKVGFISELWAFMRERKKFWLLPIIIMMAIFGGLVVLTQGSAVAPFIYTVF